MNRVISSIRIAQLGFTLLASLATACGTAPPDDDATIEQRSVTDAESIIKRSDGKYDVSCNDGRKEVVTAEQLKNDQVCLSPAPGTGELPPAKGPDDPFSTVACSQGTAWTIDAVEAKLPAGKVSTTLPATAFVRFATANCARRSNGTVSCDEWEDTAAAQLRNVELRLGVDPAAHTAKVLPLAYARGALAKNYYSCRRGHTGDLCPSSSYTQHADFGIELPIAVGGPQGSNVLTAFAGRASVEASGYPRAAASILLGQAQRTANAEPDMLYGRSPYTSGKGYYLGRLEYYPEDDTTNLDRDFEAWVIPDSFAGQFSATTQYATTVCAQVQLRSNPPDPTVSTWKKTVGAVLFRY